MSDPSRFSRFLLPAIIAQSMIMGGAYSTGREIVEYAARYGPAGWLSVFVIFGGFSVMAILSFELARVGRAYDYKAWVRLLIGPLWPLFDLLLLAMMMLVMAVMAAAIGSILEQTIGMPYEVGLAVAFFMVALLAWRGTHFIERFKTLGSVLLYLAWISFAILILTAPAPAAHAATAVAPATTGAIVIKALQYVGYNLATFPPVLFCLWRQNKRTETMSSGLITGAAMTIPFALTFLCLMRFWPDAKVMDAEAPWLPMLEWAGNGRGGAGLWIAMFGVVAGWTLLETAVGAIHAVVDRIEHNLDDLPAALRPASRHLSPWQRAAISVGILATAMVLARLGITDLVARGYGYLSWGFLLLLALPLLTVGVWRIARAPGALPPVEDPTG